ncbi:MAG: S49 family peptidase [Bryobacterales bacterium]|nr:S49 family peptidase [Bryobacterales bacterium]
MTNLTHIASRVFNTPLMVDSKKLAAILAVLAPRLGVDPPAVDAALLAEQRSRKPYAVTDAGIAIIEVAGSLVNRASGMDAQSGLTSYEQLGSEILDAATDQAVKGILLRFDSYGGEANGAWDVASMIEEAASMKPVWASVDDWALSAGYLLASSAERIWITRTGGVGSVGIIAMHLDQSGWDAANGLRYTTVFAGNRKNDFSPHEPLSEGAHDVLVTEVDRLYSMFVDAVARRRSVSATTVRGTEAGILYGDDSVNRGFADSIGTFREALAAMTESLSKPNFSKGETTVSQTNQAATSPPVPDLAAVEAAAREQGYAEAAEIVVLCAIAGRPTLAAGFIERRLPVADVRKELLAMRAEADQDEIRSHVMPETGTNVKANPENNPVMKAVERLAGKGVN